jgi:hypothetical protein
LHSRQRRVQGTTSRRALETGCLQTTHTPYVPCSIRASVLLRDDHLFGASGSEAPLPHRHWGLINHISLQAPGGPAPGTEPRLGQPTTHRASPAAVDCIGVNSDGPTAVHNGYRVLIRRIEPREALEFLGQFSSGIVSATIKSGTNDFHVRSEDPRSKMSFSFLWITRGSALTILTLRNHCLGTTFGLGQP